MGMILFVLPFVLMFALAVTATAIEYGPKAAQLTPAQRKAQAKANADAAESFWADADTASASVGKSKGRPSKAWSVSTLVRQWFTRSLSECYATAICAVSRANNSRPHVVCATDTRTLDAVENSLGSTLSGRGRLRLSRVTHKPTWKILRFAAGELVKVTTESVCKTCRTPDCACVEPEYELSNVVDGEAGVGKLVFAIRTDGALRSVRPKLRATHVELFKNPAGFEPVAASTGVVPDA